MCRLGLALLYNNIQECQVSNQVTNAVKNAWCCLKSPKFEGGNSPPTRGVGRFYFWEPIVKKCDLFWTVSQNFDFFWPRKHKEPTFFVRYARKWANLDLVWPKKQTKPWTFLAFGDWGRSLPTPLPPIRPPRKLVAAGWSPRLHYIANVQWLFSTKIAPVNK